MRIFLFDFFADDRIVAAAQTWRKLQVHSRIVDLVHFDRHNLLQLLHLLLHLNGFRGFVAETLDEVLHLSHFLLLVLVGSQLLFATLLAQHDILVVLHLVVDNLSARYFQCSVRYIINKSTIMTNQHDCFG